MPVADGLRRCYGLLGARGDTIFRAARTLDRAHRPVTGRTVEAVGAAGKHLLMRFSGDLVLRTHMRMNGSWHIYRPGERWHRRSTDMRIVVGTDDFVAVAFTVPIADFHTERSLTRALPPCAVTCLPTSSTRRRRCGG